jgi:hypothetical protein
MSAMMTDDDLECRIFLQEGRQFTSFDAVSIEM